MGHLHSSGFRVCGFISEHQLDFCSPVTDSERSISHNQDMRALLNLLLGTLFLLSATTLFAADCIPVHEAGRFVGETKCVTGKVLRVKVGTRGVHFLDFCEDQMSCPFTVVVVPSDLRDVGDVRRLEGRVIEIRGAVKFYDSRAEIVLSRISQIAGGAAMIPALPKSYDVEERGHFSAGRLRPSKKPSKKKSTPAATAIYGNEAEVEER